MNKAELIWINKEGKFETIAKIIVLNQHDPLTGHAYSIKINGKVLPAITLKNDISGSKMLLLTNTNMPVTSIDCYIEEICNFDVFKELLC